MPPEKSGSVITGGAKPARAAKATNVTGPHEILATGLDMRGLAKAFRSGRPFPHVVIDDFLRPEIAARLFEVFPDHGRDFWNVYANPLENKLTCNDWAAMPGPIADVLRSLNSREFCAELTAMTGIAGLVGDDSLHGGGMHCIKAGGKLDVHIDYRLHPVLGLERRLNLIVYLNKDWSPEYGGELELWSEDMARCKQRITPRFNRAVLFATDDTSYHGHPEPLACPPDTSRKSLALYYLTPPRKNATKRYRALFVPRPQDDRSAELETFRRLRSGLSTGPDMYRKDK